MKHFSRYIWILERIVIVKKNGHLLKIEIEQSTDEENPYI